MAKHVIHIKMTSSGLANHPEVAEAIEWLRVAWSQINGSDDVEVFATLGEHDFLAIAERQLEDRLPEFLFYLARTGDFQTKSYQGFTRDEAPALISYPGTIRK